MDVVIVVGCLVLGKSLCPELESLSSLCRACWDEARQSVESCGEGLALMHFPFRQMGGVEFANSELFEVGHT